MIVDYSDKKFVRKLKNQRKGRKSIMTKTSTTMINRNDNCIFVGQNPTRYALLTANTDSISVKLTDELIKPEKHSFLVRRSTAKDVYLPNMLINVYGLKADEENKIALQKEQINENNFILIMPKKLKENQLPINPLFGIMETWKTFPGINTKMEKIYEGFVQIPSVAQIRELYEQPSVDDEFEVTLSFRGRLFCTIKQKSQKSSDIKLADLRQIYGGQLVFYPYDILKYTVSKFDENGEETLLRIPKIWHSTTKCENPSIKGYVSELHKTGFIIKPVMTDEIISQKPLNPLKDAGKAVEFCDDTIDNIDGIRELAEAFYAFEAEKKELYRKMDEQKKTIEAQNQFKYQTEKILHSVQDIINNILKEF